MSLYKVSHVVASTAESQGGLARSVPALVQSLSALGITTELGTAAVPSDVVHINGIWLPLHHAASQAARHMRVPYIVSPRGMLEPWALAHRGWKKRLAWSLYQRRDITGAAAVHATSEAEAESVRRAGVQAPVAVIHNGVDGPDFLPYRSRGAVRRALFLSRLHPVKGLQILVDAWARVKPAGWELVVAGPDEGGHRALIEALVQKAGLSDVVSFSGPIADADKWALYRTADIFVLPTHSENFGLVVAEALAAGVPVLTTTGAPWSDLVTNGCGWQTAISADAFADTLSQATQLSRSELDAMGARGQALVRGRYGWGEAAHQMKAVYEWVLGLGERPSCLLSD